jgi:hypothetical protein
MAGYIYILSNPSFPDRIKIGRSERDPVKFRVAELYTTGVPDEFVVEYYALVENYDVVELKCHQLLKQFRPNKNREFFNYPIPEAISVIRRVAGQIKDEKVFYRTEEEIRLANERHEKERTAAAQREEKERLEREKAAQLRAARNKAVDEERRKYVDACDIPGPFMTLIGVVLGYFSFLLLAIGFGDGVVWPFLLTAAMWWVWWLVNNSALESAKREAETKFPYS